MHIDHSNKRHALLAPTAPVRGAEQSHDSDVSQNAFQSHHRPTKYNLSLLLGYCV